MVKPTPPPPPPPPLRGVIDAAVVQVFPLHQSSTSAQAHFPPFFHFNSSFPPSPLHLFLSGPRPKTLFGRDGISGAVVLQLPVVHF